MINPKIKVVGVGGAGGNAILRMANCQMRGVEFIAINCDAQDLQKIRSAKTLRIGRNLTKGLGAGMNPEIGRLAAEEQRAEIAQLLAGADMIFITCGFGGGTGTGAAPVVAEVAKSLGALVVAVITKPFSFEGVYRGQIAKQGLESMSDKVDTLLVISNDRILSLGDKTKTLISAFWTCDEVLRQAVQGITDLITLPGIINVDFADVKAVLKNSGPAFFGQGTAKGEQRAQTAVNLALSSPILDVSIKGARGILFNISGGNDLKLTEINDMARLITQSSDPKAKMIFGAVYDKKLQKDEIKLTLIATGLNSA